MSLVITDIDTKNKRYIFDNTWTQTSKVPYILVLPIYGVIFVCVVKCKNTSLLLTIAGIASSGAEAESK